MQKLKIDNPKKIKQQIQDYLRGNDEARFIHRLHGLLLIIDKEDYNCNTVGSLINNSPRSLSNWIHKLNQGQDIEVLRDKEKPGRTPRLSEKDQEHLKKVLQMHPSEVGISANIWDGKSLSAYIKKKFNIILKVRQCQRLFRKLGFSLKRARPVVAKGDPKKKKEGKKNFRK